MSKQESLCLLCRSYMCLQRYVPAGKALPEMTCKKGLYKGENMTIIISCSEFNNINPGVTINEDRGSFFVQATGKMENELYSSFEDAMSAATILLAAQLNKQELSKQKKEVS